MAWVKIDDGFADHPKMARVGPLGMALQVAALCYCNRYLTDGFLPGAVASRLVSFDGLAEPEQVIGVLVSARVWDEVEGGYQIHDYLQYQPSKAQVEATREQRAEAGRKGGKARQKQSAKQTASKGSSKTEAKSNPVPDPVPDPVPQEDSPSLRSGDVDAAPVRPNPQDHSNPDDVQPGAALGYTEAFERFWSLYPRRVGKSAAFRAWNRLLKRSRENPNPPTEEQLIAAARHYQQAMALQERPLDRIKHPSTFLSLRDRWWEEWVSGIPDGEQPATFRRESPVDRRLRETG